MRMTWQAGRRADGARFPTSPRVSGAPDTRGDHDDQRRCQGFLCLWLKDRLYVALCFMTGILPIKKCGTLSALNMFSEFSMVDQHQMIGLRYGEPAEATLAQIRERGYDRALEGLEASGDLVLCGIASDSKTKARGRVIERA